MDRPSTSQQPELFTVEEAAAILRIGRTAAYEQARRFEDTNGAEGIPVIRIGRIMRVPRVALERWIGGPISSEIPPRTRYSGPPSAESIDPKPTRRSANGVRLAQDGLPFGA
ncbi:MAG: helix-turn-helix domain-containing protein [Acidimicrobiia bacterium]|nr:helix-turn-helix domain-containing protein [Acidimicrobiia bacterium]